MTVGVVLLVRFAVGNDKSARSKYVGLTGKRSAGNKRSERGGLACSVWSGGKAARPYLSLFVVVFYCALAAAERQAVRRQHQAQLPMNVVI